MTEPASRKRPQLYGADYSVYVRIARLALLEKGVAHDLVPVDIFAEGGKPVSHLARHPFGKIRPWRTAISISTRPGRSPVMSTRPSTGRRFSLPMPEYAPG